MSIKKETTSYDSIFGDLNFKKGEDARSVYSPAAYLADLLQLLDDYFEKDKDTDALLDFDKRRADIKKLLLNEEKTFQSVPYLDIVNKLLGEKVGDVPFQKLLSKSFPFNLPFDLENEKLHKNLDLLGIKAEELYRLFNINEENNTIAQNALGFSKAFLTLLLKSDNSVDEIKKQFNNIEFVELQNVDTFLKTTSISFSELNELLYQNRDAELTNNISESYINHNLQGFADLNKSGDRIIWIMSESASEEGQETPPVQWFDRVNRFIRLSRKLKNNFVDLNLILTKCCDHKIDNIAIQRLALIQRLSINGNFEIRELITLVGNYLPSSFSELESISNSPVFSKNENKEYRRELAKLVGVSEEDLLQIADKYAASVFLPSNLDYFSRHLLINRCAIISNQLDLSIQEVFGLLDILGRDPMLQKYNIFNSLIHHELSIDNAFSILAGNDSKALVWLLQNLMALSSWMSDNQFTPSELTYIQTGELPDEKIKREESKRLIAAFNNILKELENSKLSAKDFESTRFDQRSARIINENIHDPANGLVSNDEDRLVPFSENSVLNCGYKSINKLGLITKEDFLDLGIEEKMRDKIFNNLVIKGYLNADGSLIKESFPANKEVFKINNSDSAETTEIFNVIHSILKEETEIESNGIKHDLGSAVDFSLFFSDLNEVNLPEVRQKEVYDNLIFNGYIDIEGNVLQPGFFAEPANAQKFEVNANIATYSELVYDLIEAKTLRFETEQCKINQDDFQSINLREIEVIDLIENLRFNEYLNENDEVLNKELLLNLDSNDFKLALQFYPYRHSILNTLKTKIQTFKSTFYTIKREELKEIAQLVVADLIYNHLDENFLVKNRLNKTGRLFFQEPSNSSLFDPGVYFDSTSQAIVFKFVQKILETTEKYELNEDNFSDLGLNAEETALVIAVLTKENYLQNNQFVDKDKIEFFSNIDNALTFQLEDFEDFSKDIFFVLHSITKEINEGASELVNKVKEYLLNQETAILNNLKEVLELSTEKIQVLSNHILHSDKSLAVQTHIALVNAADENGQIQTLPFTDPFFTGFNRIQRFGFLASKLNLTAQEINILFKDQNLSAKFPEALNIPKGQSYFDALLTLHFSGNELLELQPTLDASIQEQVHLKVVAMLNLATNTAWIYDALTNELLISELPLAKILPSTGESTQIDAVFNDKDGNAWAITGNQFYVRKGKESTWELSDKSIEPEESNLSKLGKVDASYIDAEGKIYLFTGDQYLRFSNDLSAIDEGYPKTIKGNWNQEHNFDFPEKYNEGFDASFENANGELYFFKNNSFTSSADFNIETEINQVWGKIKNNFDNLTHLDAAFSLRGKTYLFSGNQVITYSSSLENTGVFADEGSIQEISKAFPTLWDVFWNGIDAVFFGADGYIHFFKDNDYQKISDDLLNLSESEDEDIPLDMKWGKIQNNFREQWPISAAFAGLDGNVYLFSGDQYIRYSGHSYAKVDEGYPKRIRDNWGGLENVESAFVMDGKTYLFGVNAENQKAYVRYSSNDYTTEDKGYPQVPIENWWNLPFQLIEEGFSAPDSVFVGQDGVTYLIKNSQFVSFDNLHRWWSEPASISSKWNNLPFETIDAGFTGKDGRTYLFSDLDFVRYSDKTFNKIDPKFPKKSHEFWGKVANNIEQNQKIDACLLLTQTHEDFNQTHTTYIFSGNQYFRYSGTIYDKVDESYPKSLDQFKNEKGIENLTTNFPDGIDAAFSDNRNVYLFDKNRCHIVSSSLYKEYRNVFDLPIRTAIVENGSFFIEDQVGWRRLKNIESNYASNGNAQPLILDKADKDFRSNLDSILQGTDKNTYFFKNGFCYNETLDKIYPIQEEWGKVRNSIKELNQIDAGFLGRDGKMYVFSDDQFWAYNSDDLPAPDKTMATFSLENPQLIVEKWGLDSVQVAFVKEEKTYLFEHPDENNNVRYICFDSDTYEEIPESKITDFSWWNIPLEYVEEGFSQVEGVAFEKDNMFLFCKDEFIQYNLTDDVWTYPKPIGLIWRGYASGTDKHNTITSVFRGPDQVDYFFFEGSFAIYKNGRFSDLEDIKTFWGLSQNNIAETGQVNATFVSPSGATYLFSGNQFYKYSNSDYEFIDETYPRLINNDLRKEVGFENLSDDFFKLLKSNGQIDGLLNNGRTMYLLLGQDCIAVSSESETTIPLNRLGQLKNNIQDANKIDAAFSHPDLGIYLISEDQYVRYSEVEQSFVDIGYPKPLSQLQSEFSTLFDEKFAKSIDATFLSADGELYLFKEASYIKVSEEPTLNSVFELLNNGETSFELNTTNRLNAGFVSPDGSAYFFKGNKYVKYNDFANPHYEEGYPKPIAEHWGNLPVEFRSEIEGAFVFNGKTYLRNGDSYVRYAKSNYSQIEPTFPKKFVEQWKRTSDFSIVDLKAIAKFKSLSDQHRSDELSLPGLLDAGKRYVKDPFKKLSEIFNWDQEEVQWLKRNNAFLEKENDAEIAFNIELILKMEEAFQLAKKVGLEPSILFEKVYNLLFVKEEIKQANEQLNKLIELANTESDWKIIKDQIKNELNLIKRDALLPYVIANDADVEDAGDLFAKMLLDVEMGKDAKTSEVKEAISALQLYFHRYFINQESLRLEDGMERKELKKWWSWMKNYRVWEANRKVFLYPENYIRPELRKGKTPAFKNLETALLQGELTEDLIQSSFNNYLTEFEKVGNLKITGANEYSDGDNTVLILFGHTRTEPAQYYYRTAKFSNKDNGVIWENWEELGIKINSTRVFPVYAFGRLMVFWTEISAYEETSPVVVSNAESSTSEIDDSDKVVNYKSDIKYSFYDFNKKWINPQTLLEKIDLDYNIDSAYVDNGEIVTFSGKYCLKSSKTNPSGDVRTIKEVFNVKNRTALPEIFYSGIDAAVLIEGKKYFFRNNLVVSPGGESQAISSLFVTDNRLSRKSPIFEFFKKLTPLKTEVPEYTKGVAAAFYLNKTVCLIDHHGGYNFFKWNATGSVFKEIADDIGGDPFWTAFINVLTHNLLKLSPVDAVFEDAESQILYVLRKGQYSCYKHVPGRINVLEELDGFPKPIKGNLTFNMDKFFNKLHVVNVNDKYINLNYVIPNIPEESALISGKILPDFEFLETEIRDKVEETFLLEAENELKPFLSFNTDNDDSSLAEFKKSNAHLELIKEDVDFLTLIEKGVTDLEKTIEKSAPSKIKSGLEKIRTNLESLDASSDALYKKLDLAIAPMEKALELDGSNDEKKAAREKAIEQITDKLTVLKRDLDSRKTKMNSNLLTWGYKLRTANQFWNISVYHKIDRIKTKITELRTKNEDQNLSLTSKEFDKIKSGLDAYKKHKTTFENIKKSISEISKDDIAFPQGDVSKKVQVKVTQLGKLISELEKINTSNNNFDTLLEKLEKDIRLLRELYYGRFDLFPTEFDIQNKTNFTFGQPDWYVFEEKSGTLLCRPLPSNESIDPQYEIIRLTSNSIPLLSNRLFAFGIDGFLSLTTQVIDERPYFKEKKDGEGQSLASFLTRAFTFGLSADTRIPVAEDLNRQIANAERPLQQEVNSNNTITYSPKKIKKVPVSLNLDFNGASSNYYWEIFFHAPYLIANALNNAQKFEEAKKWYEYIFDPSSEFGPWQFLPMVQIKEKDYKTTLKEHLLNPHPDAKLESELAVYREDPFDPHAIARLRQVAYPKAILMSYIDNLLDWGDVLFRQYSVESINEARMLYVLASDLLGEQPEYAGKKELPTEAGFKQLSNPDDKDDLLLNKIHNSVEHPYFHIPNNEIFMDYWSRVNDRLYKIRHSLNIDGVKQALPLFQPPIDPMALVQAAASGGGLSQALSMSSVEVPHYRFDFMLYKARELQQKLAQFGGELLNAIEKRDAEELSLMQNEQEGIILEMMTQVKEAQIEEANSAIKSLEESLKFAERRIAYNEETIEEGLLPQEEGQIGVQISSAALHGISSIMKIAASFGQAGPDVLAGPFIMGVKHGGSHFGEALNAWAEVAQSAAEGLSIVGEVLAVYGQHKRMVADWEFEVETAKSDIIQIQNQIKGAELQKQIAQYELQIHEKEIDQRSSIATFMKDKFSNSQLHQWMAGKLSGLYYQTYKMAMDMAKSAEKAMQFEKGLEAKEVNFISGMYWDSQKKGLLSGESLGLDIDRMEQAFIANDKRRLEISKSISLLELNPKAFLDLKANGTCEFGLSEALFDYDFQGHYCRQIKTISLSFDAGEGQTINATLTQLGHKTVLKPDANAVKFLLDPKGDQPTAIRSNWKANQQIALSYVEEYDTNNGLFEMRFDDQKYLPFEGTGAVSQWRLELNGKRGSYDLKDLLDIIVNVKYTALQGGAVFGNAVKGLLKPYQTVKYFDLNYDFHNEWMDFVQNDEEVLVLNFNKSHFPNMASNKITGIFTRFDLLSQGNVSLLLNENENLVLNDGKTIEPAGLSIKEEDSEWSFSIKGDKSLIKNILLIIGYKAKV